MGGLVSRYYLQNLGGASRCETLITISSPHQGTEAAWLYPTKGAREMRPRSEFLKNLHSTEDRLGNMQLVSYRTPLDLVIVPSKNSIWPRAENVSYPVALHPFMLTSAPVLDDIEKRLVR
jgi:triacylglycerol lipase